MLPADDLWPPKVWTAVYISLLSLYLSLFIQFIQCTTTSFPWLASVSFSFSYLCFSCCEVLHVHFSSCLPVSRLESGIHSFLVLSKPSVNMRFSVFSLLFASAVASPLALRDASTPPYPMDRSVANHHKRDFPAPPSLTYVFTAVLDVKMPIPGPIADDGGSRFSRSHYRPQFWRERLI